MVLGTFITARAANLCANAANSSTKIRATRHFADRQRTNVGAASVKLDTTRHHLHIGFMEARRSAMFAGNDAGVTSIDTGLEFLMAHIRGNLGLGKVSQA